MSVASTLAAGTIKQLNRWKCFNGAVYKYIHLSTSTKTEMKFTVFMPAAASTSNRVPALYWLSGLTCTEDNFIHKAGAMRAASHHGVALICPDTSPRGVKIEGDSDHWDFGVGAGFYVDAVRAPWSSHYRMYSYVTQELPSLIQEHLPVTEKRSVFGHSMGGHGALICFLKNPGFYQSVSAFAPICNPSQTGWGIKAFTGYLGEEKKDLWKSYDATELVSTYSGPSTTILIDQGNVDEWLEKKELEPQRFISAAQGNSKVTIDYRERDGYDHSYFYIQTFIDEHIEYHAKVLKGTGAKL